jgi:gliding motility-associated-like protein
VTRLSLFSAFLFLLILLILFLSFLSCSLVQVKLFMRTLVTFTLLFTLTALQAQDLTAGLVGYYSFCDCNANDHSGNDNHGILHGTPECTEGIKGEGFQFNTTPGNNGCGQAGGEYVELPTLGAIWQDGFTVCAWTQYENISTYERIVDLGNASGENGGMPVWFGREGNSNNLAFESWISADGNLNRTTGRLTAQNAITNGQIELYCATISGNNMRIYVNGALAAQKTGNPISNVERSSNYIGRSNWCANDPDFKGFMDEVRIYNRALSEEEIELMFTFPFSPHGGTIHICPEEEVQLNMQGGDRYEWSPSQFLSSDTIGNPIATPPNSIEYNCKIIFPDGCFVEEMVSIEVHEDVASMVTEDICNGTDYFGYTEAGFYVDTLQTVYGCDSIRTLELSIRPAPERSENISICAGGIYEGFTETGTYTYLLPASIGCDTIVYLNLDVNNMAFAGIHTFDTACGDESGSVNFSVTDRPNNLQVVLNGDNIFSKGESVEKLAAGEYQLLLSDGNGCEIDTVFQIGTLNCPVYVPNVFSPNRDGVNDRFQIFAADNAEVNILSFKIFSRWGALVYSQENLPIAAPAEFWWDGNYDGKAAADGVYSYYIQLAFSNGNTDLLTGDINLVH